MVPTDDCFLIMFDSKRETGLGLDHGVTEKLGLSEELRQVVVSRTCRVVMLKGFRQVRLLR